MTGRMDKTHPVIQKEIHAQVDDAMRSRGIDLEDPVRADLLRRVEVLLGYRDQPVIRFRDHDQTLLPADTCLDRLLNATEHTANASPGPARIPWSDKQALLGLDIAKVGRGEIVVFDDRSAR